MLLDPLGDLAEKFPRASLSAQNARNKCLALALIMHSRFLSFVWRIFS